MPFDDKSIIDIAKGKLENFSSRQATTLYTTIEKNRVQIDKY
jgi:hypothetical protein